MERFRREPIAGLLAFTLACGFLLGALVSNVRDGTADVQTTAGGGGTAGDVLAGNQDLGGGSVAGEPGATATTVAGGATPTGGAAPASPTGAAATASGATVQGGSTAAPTATARGVSDKTIKLGIACIDLSVLRNVPQYDAGDQRAEFESVVEGWKRKGLLPVHGRDLELYFRCFNVLSAEDQRATAVELVRDKGVFAVVAHCCFRDGSEIVAREMRTPLVGVDPVLDTGYQRSAPFLFTAGASLDLEARNYAHWIKATGLIGKKIGFYYYNDATQPHIVQVMRSELAKLGNTNSVTFSTDNQLGGPEDSLAVQRFNAERVEAVVLMTSAGGFIQAAASQRYEPQYLQSDFGAPTITDTSTATYDGENFDGALAMTLQRAGEWRDGPVSPPTKECEDNYFKYKNQRIDGPTNESQWGALLYACDVMNLTLHGLQQAGRNLTPASFVKGLETAAREGARYGNLTFTPAKHHGANSWRTVQWKNECRCWRVQTRAFQAFFVP